VQVFVHAAGTDYLSHIISADNDPAKSSAIQHWPQPHNVKQLLGFVGLTGYYRKFIRQSRVISHPLTNLVKKDTPFVWSPIANEAFVSLKQSLVHPHLSDFHHEFVLEKDSCATGVGSVLMQKRTSIGITEQSLGATKLVVVNL
jgi:hypothetical protein